MIAKNKEKNMPNKDKILSYTYFLNSKQNCIYYNYYFGEYLSIFDPNKTQCGLHHFQVNPNNT